MPRQLDIQAKLAALRIFHEKEGRSPSYTEMLTLFGYRSRAAVAHLIKRLAEKGYVQLERGRLLLSARVIGLKMLGSVVAGFPSPAEEELVDVMSLDEFMIRNKASTYLLKVEGDSMIDEGIRPGDIALVDTGRTPRSGDIVVAEVDGQWTLKFYIKEGRSVRLEAANKRFKAIQPQDSLRIFGVVTGTMRKYVS